MAKTELCEVPVFNLKEHAKIDDYHGYEAEGIIRLYRETYQISAADFIHQRSYPYPETLDPEWVDATAKHPDTIWKVVTDTLTGRVIGSGIVLLNRENQRAYVRGVMIDPKYQGCGLGGYILVNAFREIIQSCQGQIKIFWTESRTAHNKSQKIAEDSGLRPVGLLPNKDFFLEKRESDLLMVLYSMNTLKNRRPDPQLIREVLPIFEVMRQQYRLDPVVAVSSPIITANGYEVKGYITTDRYDYCYCTYRANNKELKFLINPRTQVAENTSFSPDIDAITLKTLLRNVRLSLNPHLSYMECYVSAFRPDLQQVFVDLGFQPTGYIPGWDLIGEKREDAIVMTWTRQMPALTDIHLTERGMKIANLFLH